MVAEDAPAGRGAEVDMDGREGGVVEVDAAGRWTDEEVGNGVSRGVAVAVVEMRGLVALKGAVDELREVVPVAAEAWPAVGAAAEKMVGAGAVRIGEEAGLGEVRTGAGVCAGVLRIGADVARAAMGVEEDTGLAVAAGFGPSTLAPVV